MNKKELYNEEEKKIKKKNLQMIEIMKKKEMEAG